LGVGAQLGAAFAIVGASSTAPLKAAAIIAGELAASALVLTLIAIPHTSLGPEWRVAGAAVCEVDHQKRGISAAALPIRRGVVLWKA
jgi:hypothetical protein